VLQDAYLRYAAAESQRSAGQSAEIRSLKAYLSTIVTRLCLDRLKSARSVREQYLGPWLPEPVLTLDDDLDMQRSAEQHESITLAFLVLLETLTPQERAVFLLREVFEYEYGEIAETLGLGSAYCRQLFHRAKQHIAEGRRRFRPSAERQHHLVERFLAATQRGDVQALASMLAHDATVTADGGGKAPAARRPVHGRDAIAQLVIGIVQKGLRVLRATQEDLRFEIRDVNGEPALLLWVHERLDSIFVYSVVEEQIASIHAIRNPDKLAYIRRQLRHQT
jgi:RNA polymerase sigma-70 factor (ECF subfamily)